jgi:AhpD family alkylhydroperoxidase
MNIEEFNARRKRLVELMRRESEFFEQFGNLDVQAYSEGAIPKRYKELIGLVISLVSRCEECALFHLQQLKETRGTSEEIIEAIELALIGTGSVTYPYVRKAFEAMQELGFALRQR